MSTRSFFAIVGALALASCVAPRNPPPAPPAASPRLVAQPLVPPAEAPLVQPGEDWRDIPLTRGDWRYSPAPGGGRSTFGPPGDLRFAVRCDLASRAVTLERTGGGASTLTIRTSSATRTLPAQAGGGSIVASLQARDPFLDAIAFSRGRFVVTSPPLPRLVIPAWPEFARVVENCRG